MRPPKRWTLWVLFARLSILWDARLRFREPKLAILLEYSNPAHMPARPALLAFLAIGRRQRYWSTRANRSLFAGAAALMTPCAIQRFRCTWSARRGEEPVIDCL